MPVERWVLLALFVLLALAQLLAHWVRRVKASGRAASPDQSERRDQTAGPPAGPARNRRKPPGTQGEPGQASRPAPGAPAGVRPPARSRLGTLQELRRGIVLMTVLGPCRALESVPVTPGSPERRTHREGHP
jgi:hypothetical protein